MQESMMMADVGGMVNVSGSRMATPLAPPSPGSTPMMTPSRMPTSINATLYQESATLKPPMSELISSTRFPSQLSQRCSLDLALGQVHCHSARLVYIVPNAEPAQYGNWPKLRRSAGAMLSL